MHKSFESNFSIDDKQKKSKKKTIENYLKSWQNP